MVSSRASSKSLGGGTSVKQRLANITKEHKSRFKDGKGHPLPLVRRLVRHPVFETVVNLLIMANCGFVGIQANTGVAPEDVPDPGLEAAFGLAEHVFTFCFCMDLLLQVLARGWTWLFDASNWLDIFLVVLSVLVSWILVPAGMDVEFLRKLTVLRTLRLTRLARAVKSKPQFKEMWALLKGLLDSVETLCWTYVMIFVFLYFFAVMSTSIIGRQEVFETNDLVQVHFGDVPRSLLTLFQVMTLDSWSALCRSIMKGDQVWIALFFVIFITMGQFVLMNLIMAVIVENAFSDSKTEEEELARRKAAKKAQEAEELKLFFQVIDEDHSGKLTKDELYAAVKKKRKVRQKLRALDVMPKDIEELWDCLDDGDGELTAEEFATGLQRLRGEAKAKDVMRLYRELRILEGSVSGISESLDMSEEKMAMVKHQLKQARVDISSLQRTLTRARDSVKVAAVTQPLR